MKEQDDREVRLVFDQKVSVTRLHLKGNLTFKVKNTQVNGKDIGVIKLPYTKKMLQWVSIFLLGWPLESRLCAICGHFDTVNPYCSICSYAISIRERRGYE